MTTTNNTVLFLAPIPFLSPDAYRPLSQPIANLTRITAKRLLVVLVSAEFDDGGGDLGGGAVPDSPERGLDSEHGLNSERDDVHWHAIQRLLTFVYVQASKVAAEQDNLLLQVDVLLKTPRTLRLDFLEGDEEVDVDVVYRFENDHLEVSSPLARVPQRRLGSFTLGEPHASSTNNDGSSTSTSKDKTGEFATPLSRFPVIALGGTFDHLHAGHKILLSMAAWLASKRLIAGVTDTSLLGSKSNKEYLEPLETRITRTRAFLKLFKPSLTYDVVPIKDVYGPTGWDPDVQALVVSRETLSGASAIATHRAAHDLPPLQTFVIDVISAEDESIMLEDAVELRKAKMSSTAIREWIAARVGREYD